MNRKKLVAYEWAQYLLCALFFIVTVCAACWAVWFLWELSWALRCAFGV